MTPGVLATPARVWPGFEGIRPIDCDMHNQPTSRLADFMTSRWRDYLQLVGRRAYPQGTPLRLAARPMAQRMDTVPPGGGMGGSDPDFSRQQLLDEYGITAAVIGTINASCGNSPVGLQVEVARATNDYNREIWFAADPRWRSSINTMPTDPSWSAAEIARCHGLSSRYVQVYMDTHTERPAGDPMYWPIYEAAVEHGLPVAFHLNGLSGNHQSSGVGEYTFYYEVRTSLTAYAQPLVSSLIFEGVFDQFPALKVILVELEWTWVVPMIWRMDAAWRTMRAELPSLFREPSDYLREHFWFTTQPALDPEHPEQFYEAYSQFERNGFGDRLMFASDYPHWDMDSPFDSMPAGLPRATKERILAGNAAALYGLEQAVQR